ncbi:MAG TPA: MFS transporter [Anaerolineales bacterium]|nr:MFS transporter [Anaerolineales bacterium]
MVNATTRKTPSDIRWYDYLTININWFALSTRSQVLTPLVIPLLVQQFVGESTKGAAVGTLRLWALMAALLFQSLMGLLTDRNTSRWGRRRPFIVIGTLGEIVIFMLIGWSAALTGMRGYWVLFGLYLLSALTSNTSQAATSPLIPDLVPDEKKGLFSGIKAALELPIPLIFVSFVVGGMIAKGHLWGALFSLSGVLLICMVLSLFIREQPLEEAPPIDWVPFLRLFMMTAAFTALILGIGWGVNQVIRNAADLPSSTKLPLVGLVGLAGMSLAIGLGVWVSAQIGLGKAIDERPSFRWWVINRLAFLVGVNNLGSFIVFFLQEKFPEFQAEKAAGPAARIIMFVGIFILLTAIPSGWLSDRFGKKPLIVVSGLLAVIGTVIVVLAPDMDVILVGACLIGSGVGFFYSANWALGTEIVPADRAGQFFGVANLAGAGAGAVGAYIGGPIADANSFVLLMAIYGGVILLSIFALVGVKPKTPAGTA